MALTGHGIRFHFFDNTKGESVCDICGLSHHILIKSDVFDNGNASDTVITLCRSCVRSLDVIFEG